MPLIFSFSYFQIKGTTVVAPITVQASEPDSLSNNLNCKHDLSQCEDNPTDLPTLLNPRETLLGNLFSETDTLVTFKEKSDMFGFLKVSGTLLFVLCGRMVRLSAVTTR